MRRLLLVALVVIVASTTLLAGGRREQQEEVKRLTWAVVPYQPHFVEIPQQIAAAYMRMHPNVRIEVTAIPNEEFFTKMPTLVAAGEVPDILFNHGGNTEAFAQAGVTMDLAPFLTSGDRGKYPLQVEDFDEGFVSLMTTMRGEIHTLPVAADTYVMYYNKRLFDEAGVPYPSDNWSYADLRDYARRITGRTADGTQQYGFAFDPVQSHNAIQGPGAAGFEVGQLGNNDEYNFNSPVAVEGWRYYFDGLRDGWAMPVDEVQDIGGFLNAFALGRVAMVPGGRWAVPIFRENLDDDWDVVVMPRGVGPSGRHFANGGAFGYSVASTTRHPEVAVDFLLYIYSQESYELWTANYSVVPTVKTLFGSDLWQSLPGPPYNNAAFVDALDHMIPYPQEPWFHEEKMNQVYRDIIDKVVAGVDLQQALDEGVRVMNQEIRERKAEYIERHGSVD